jgi:VWFA-related protein
MSVRNVLAGGLILLTWVALSPFQSTRAQGNQGPITPKQGTSIQKPPDNAIRVRVALVSMPVTVRDGSGELVLNLEKKNFHVLDNGVEQTLESFDLGGEPLSAVLVFETSTRIAPLIPAVQKSAILFTQTVVGPSGDAAILSYDETVDKLLPFTADHDQIEKTIANLKPATSGARLYDAMANAVSLLRERTPDRRRAIIVVGEARDSGSEQKLGEVLRQAQLANVVIYTVGLSTTAADLKSQPRQAQTKQATPPGTFGMPPVPGTAQTPTSEQQQRGGSIDLMALAEWTVEHATAVVKDHPLEVATVATGGMYQSTFRDRSIENAVDAIGGELNAQYMLSYRPTGSDPGYHQIKVTIDHPDLKVRTRPGYYLEAR